MDAGLIKGCMLSDTCTYSDECSSSADCHGKGIDKPDHAAGFRQIVPAIAPTASCKAMQCSRSLHQAASGGSSPTMLHITKALVDVCLELRIADQAREGIQDKHHRIQYARHLHDHCWMSGLNLTAAWHAIFAGLPTHPRLRSAS